MIVSIDLGGALSLPVLEPKWQGCPSSKSSRTRRLRRTLPRTWKQVSLGRSSSSCH